ncbi:hypothetical protein [Geobacillus thermodenitrificans]|uniref:Nb.BsrDI n=1 Tax=Geobacillus stearothermophilus TaxID=1422 RepID=A1XI22_GEOSE|nr:R2.BsrDI [Geobacillus stearothermophilus]
MTEYDLHLYADSFHEGHWCCENLAKIAQSDGGKHQIDYLQGFIPRHSLIFSDLIINITVFGSYKSWKHLPKQIKDLLFWGKPDFIAYDPKNDKILFAVEETGAVPTGNQALQRCERIYGSARKQIPFWYLLSEFGQHKDGGTRRDSIWPTIMGLKLTQLVKTPSIILHYSDINNPEDYNSGNGLKFLFKSLLQIIINYCTLKNPLKGMLELLSIQYENMLEFIKSQWKEQIDFLPGEEILNTKTKELARMYASLAIGQTVKIPEELFNWPRTDKVNFKSPQGLIKYDELCYQLEKAVGSKKAYCLSNNAGAKPQKLESLKEWINSQKKLFDKAPKLTPPAEFNMKLDAFPVTSNNNYYVTTSKNILYLFDYWKDLRIAIETAFPRLKGKLPTDIDEKPALIYICNSVKPGRLFGDPFTGQLSAFSTIFGKKNIDMPRIVVAYYPHQIYSQALPKNNKSNKGITLKKELTDFLIFHGGVVVKLNEGKAY